MKIWREFWIAVAAIAFTIAALLLFSTESEAQTREVCGPEQQLLAALYRNYQEFPVWRGEDGQGNKVIITRSKGDGGWTLLVGSGGKFCIKSAGARSHFDNGV